MAIHRMFLTSDKKPNSAQIEEIKNASLYPVNLEDPDAPELSDIQLRKIAAMATVRRTGQRKQTVLVPLSPDTMEKARKLGAGYTGVLARIISHAMDDPEFLKKCL